MRFHRILLIGISLLASFYGAVAAMAPDTVVQVSEAIHARADWLKEVKICPAEIVPQKESRDYLVSNTCKADSQLTSCLVKCTSGEGGSCYWLAYAIQQRHGDPMSSEVLYQRSCKLGIMSGCTNRAAGMLSDAPNNRTVQQCAAHTFAKVCAFDDPWACSMYGLHLSRGLGVPQNTELALKVLEKSCKYGPEDPACSGGMKLKRELEQRRLNSSTHK